MNVKEHIIGRLSANGCQINDQHHLPTDRTRMELGEEINPVMYTAQEWEKYRNTPFVRNVEKEGVKM